MTETPEEVFQALLKEWSTATNPKGACPCPACNAAVHDLYALRVCMRWIQRWLDAVDQ